MENTLTPAIENRIFTIRGTQVMMDRDLAAVYDVSTTRLNEQVSRNLRRFPETFCFYLTKEELQFWISQNATSKSIKIGLRKPPRVFTEYGVAMVSSIINSQRAVEVSVQIIQAFVFMKKAMMQGNLLSPHPSWWSGIVQDIRHS
jgi:hypothetical protein